MVIDSLGKFSLKLRFINKIQLKGLYLSHNLVDNIKLSRFFNPVELILSHVFLPIIMQLRFFSFSTAVVIFLKSFNSSGIYQGKEFLYPIPPFGSEGENYRFLLRNHAYAIDPPMAKNLLAHVLQFGLHNTVDFLSRTDIFHVTHQGVYAYDERGQTTITGLDRLNK